MTVVRQTYLNVASRIYPTCDATPRNFSNETAANLRQQRLALGLRQRRHRHEAEDVDERDRHRDIANAAAIMKYVNVSDFCL
jgi:hypothetical protein